MIEFLFWLAVGHALADWPLQGAGLSYAKRPGHSDPTAAPWYLALTVHGLIHAGAVALVLGSVELGIAEFCAHCLIDYSKSTGRFGSGHRATLIDQSLHAGCKFAWIGLVMLV